MPRSLGLGVFFGTKPIFPITINFNRLPFTPSSGRLFGPSGGNTRKTPVPLLELSICSLYLSFYFYKGPTLLPSRWMNQLGTMQLAIDRERRADVL